MKYGDELILTVSGCNPLLFSRKRISDFFFKLCDRMGMKAEEQSFWDDVGVHPDEQQDDPRTKGTTAIQFILTSNITIHTFEDYKAALINVFSCDDFDSDEVVKFAEGWFEGTCSHRVVVPRMIP